MNPSVKTGRPNLEAMKRHAQIFPEFRKEDVLQLVAWTEKVERDWSAAESELQKVRHGVVLTPEQAGQVIEALDESKRLERVGATIFKCAYSCSPAAEDESSIAKELRVSIRGKIDAAITLLSTPQPPQETA